MVLPLASSRVPTAQTLVLLMAAIPEKPPDAFTWSVWYQAELVALAVPGAARAPTVIPPTVASDPPYPPRGEENSAQHHRHHARRAPTTQSNAGFAALVPNAAGLLD
jgi:hypothetical protein